MSRIFCQFASLAILLGCFFVPLAGCGGPSEPVGVDDNGLEEAEEFQDSEEYVSGEEGI
ncbi:MULTISPECIES: hypothetical protein [Rhodopirellula]|jgi:hypothetical protein|uniref:hypothetical protein n=1 Tax=Rhodopirellula TaxID=265488 RepID=UPI002579950A|nr:hypothetical protein [Rhodopirellula sp. UBA1907]|tara:strand:- start:753 stop:929 length:177 start_codon:yes stop_codon:yes gene_type:complete